MPSIRVRYIRKVRAKGRTYWYHRITGERLPEQPEARLARALAINEGLAPKPVAAAPAGSLDALVVAYLGSAEFAALAPGSRKVYRFFLGRLREVWGKLPVAGIRPRHVLHLRDALRGRPAYANYLLRIARILFAWGAARELVDGNPAEEIRALRHRRRPHRIWTPPEVARLLGVAPPEVALATRLALYTGQRLGDVLKMSWADLDGSAIRVVQAKTGNRLWIPLHRDLARALGKIGRASPLIVASAAGGARLPRQAFEVRWRAARAAAGLEERTFHGLRHTAASNLAEVGCSANQIQGVLGMASLATAQGYTRQADQKRLAKAAIARLETAGRKPRKGRKRNAAPR